MLKKSSWLAYNSVLDKHPTNYIKKKNIQDRSRWIQTEAPYACIKKGANISCMQTL